MATTKKTTQTTKKSRSSASTKSSPTTRKKPATKKPAPKAAATRSDAPFMSLRPTVETVYWLIFSVAILALGVWVLNLTIRINDIYNQIDMNESMMNSIQSPVQKPADKTK